MPLFVPVLTLLLSGVLLYLLNNEKFNREYTEAYTNASLIVREDYGFEDGLFTGYDAEKRKYDKSSRLMNWTKTASPSAIPRCNIRAACGTC